MADASGSKPPSVMVSSTFYDLRHIRDDLRRFLSDQLGYRALLSEHASFPINPELTTIDNCRERVRQDADVLVLIVGARYGSIDDRSAKSVTNLEYLAAREKGIPIFAFVDESIVPLVTAWTLNPGVAFPGQVDTVQLLEFVNTVRSTDGVWTSPFKTAQDIIEALRIQFAYQHERGLRLARQLRPIQTASWMQDLHGKALRVALERPEGWEYLLFLNALNDFIGRHYRARGRHRVGVAIGLGEDVGDAVSWMQLRIDDVHRIIGVLNRLFADPLTQALGPPGFAGDPAAIVAVADAISEVYVTALAWHDRVITANVNDSFARMQSILGKLLDAVIDKMERFAPESLELFNGALRDQNGSDSPRTLNLILTLDIPNELIKEFYAELSRLKREFT